MRNSRSFIAGMAETHNKALFLDRDGTLNVDTCYVCEPDKMILIPGVRDALVRARAMGFRFYMVTNQSGVGRGYFTIDDVHACNRRLLEMLDLGEDLFAGICIAPEHPDEPGEYRKPSPKYLLEMITRDQLDPAQCYMLGDRRSDWQCGLNAGVNPVALRTGNDFDSKAEALIAEHGIPVWDSLAEFVSALERGGDGRD
ncbi:MAG: D-glycero-alpha-D-manno-heptose-1,7-bisphosphate 7-phosphatase [Puniceicoccales bacterium]